MTQQEFSSQILELVDNGRYCGKPDEEVIGDIMLFLNVLEPRDRKDFSKWGYPPHQVDVDRCWSE